MEDSRSKPVYCEICGRFKERNICQKCELESLPLSLDKMYKSEFLFDGFEEEVSHESINSFKDYSIFYELYLIENIFKHIDEEECDDPFEKSLRLIDDAVYLKLLRMNCLRNNIDLQFLPKNSARHRQNTTFFDCTKKEFFWRIEWVFPQADNLLQITERAEDTKLLAAVLEEVMYPCDTLTALSNEKEKETKEELQNKLKRYDVAQLSGSKVLFKIEEQSGANDIYNELDISLTLRENFENKTIIEFPRLYVVLKNHIDEYKIVKSDDAVSVKRSQAVEEYDKQQESYLINFMCTDSSESDED